MSQEEQQQGVPVLAFGPFRLHRSPPMLCIGEEPVRLGGRALDLLVALVERAGDVVSRAELERQVWPHSLVEDSSLRVHVAALRKALGDGVGEARYIANVPGRGYSFVATVTPQQAVRPGDAESALPDAPAARPLPVRLTSIVGRDDALAALCHDLPARRLATIVGHGGMGKTALALAVAYRLGPGYADGACFVDLAPLGDPALVPNALAAALGIAVFGASVMQTLDTWLRPRRMLIVVDNCEHLLDAATVLIDRVLRLAPGIDVLATSREPLDADGEWVHRLTPLASPPEGEPLNCEQALAYPALRLLVERAAASVDSFELTDASLPSAIALCRRLDGVPLAIEFAAARIGLLGVHGVLAQLDDRLRLLGSGRRTVLPRHRTLRALLDWSYDLLPESQRRVLRGCGIFHGPFTLESAAAVLADEAMGPDQVRDAVLALIAKSLIVAELGAPQPSFGMLEITRAYALDLLGADPGHAIIARRHACHMIDLMRQCELDWESTPRDVWLGVYLHSMSNVRGAMNWAFGAGGDASIGVRLAGAMMLQMARVLSEEELRAAARRALEAIAAGTPVEARDEMRLHSLVVSMSGPGSGVPLTAGSSPPPPSYLRAYQDGARRGRVDEQVEALYHLGSRLFGAADYPGTRDTAARIAELGAGSANAAALVLGERLAAQAAHFLGQHGQARLLATRVLSQLHITMPLRLASPVDRAVSMRIVLARALWMQGFGEQAARVASECLALAERDLTPISLAQALGLAACPLALWRGDHAGGRALADRMAAHAERHAMTYWGGWVQHFRRALSLATDGGAQIAGPAIPLDAKQLDHLATFAPALAMPGALARCRAGLAGWSAPEVLRVHGEQLLAAGGDGEAVLLEALALAREQQAPAWALRCATSLARLRCAQGRAGEGLAPLQALVDSFTEDLDSGDLRAARALLAAAR